MRKLKSLTIKRKRTPSEVPGPVITLGQWEARQDLSPCVESMQFSVRPNEQMQIDLVFKRDTSPETIDEVLAALRQEGLAIGHHSVKY